VKSSVKRKNNQKKQGFTIVEIMVALVILAVGLLGMAGMTVVVMRGSRGAEDLSNATNVCQQKIEELKDILWSDLGNAASGDTDALDKGVITAGMMQEVDLNSQGLTWEGYCNQQSGITGSACEGQGASCGTGTVGTSCKAFLDQAGPYKYSRTFAICKGEDYDTASPSEPLFNSMKAFGGGSPTTLPPTEKEYSAVRNCLVNPADNSTRPMTLACENNDILSGGIGSPEKMIKILCTWRAKDGRCSFVNFEALRMDNL
jgi:prepilin-type N-terminal cleavage/methylation domain-containing protein